MSIDIKEAKSVEGMLTFVSESPIIFDVGSNKGEWSDVILREFGDNCHVHFFEPNPIMLNYTRIKYDYNKNIVFNPFAVCDVPDIKLDFFYFENYNNGLSSIYKNDSWSEQNLPMQKGTANTTTIDSYCESNSIKEIDILKIDVEGADPLVIKGADKMLKAGKVKIIQIEYGAHYKLGSHNFSDIIKRLGGYGYHFYTFNDDNYVKVDTDKFVEDFRFENFIITKEQLENSQDWNRAFKKNVEDFGKAFNFALEIGTFEGMTARYICDNILLDGGRMICVDPLEDVYLTEKIDGDAEKMNSELPYFKGQYNRFLRNTKNRPVNLMRMTSENAYPLLSEFRFDFIFIDGDHRHDAVYLDATECFKICRLQGYILFDDFTWSEGTREAIEKFLKEYQNKIIVISKNEQVLIQKIKDE